MRTHWQLAVDTVHPGGGCAHSIGGQPLLDEEDEEEDVAPLDEVKPLDEDDDEVDPTPLLLATPEDDVDDAVTCDGPVPPRTSVSVAPPHAMTSAVPAAAVSTKAK